MRFLVTSKSISPFPMEAALGMTEAMSQWVEKYQAGGQMEQVWAFAGTQGGGGILNVETPEELDDIMTEYPFAPFSQIDVYPLSDLKRSLEKNKEFIGAMMAAMAAH